MSNRTKFNRSDRIGSQSIPGTNRWILFAVVFLAMSFNYILCFLNTNVVPVTRLYVQLSEGFIISSALIISFRNIRLSEYAFIAGVSLYSILTILIRAATSVDGSIDVQPIRDLIIPIAFYLLGTRSRSIRDVDTIVALSAILVAIGAVFEYFFLDTYLKFFNVIKYYIARGTVSVQETVYLANDLWVSGIRPEGRSLLPFLGDHRVSSIFLEPVSPGNFAVILFFWAIIRSGSKKRIDYFLFAISLFLTVMSDNRFGLTTCVLGLFVYILAAVGPKAIVSSVLMIMPLVAIGLLMVIGYAYSNLPVDDSFLGRAISSGQSLLSLDFLAWLGFQGPKNVISSFDSGYTYSLTIIGITGFSVLWLTFLTIKGPGRQFFLYRTLSAFYLALILCVSYSPFTIKTAALLWFLLGSLAPRNTAQLSEQSRSTNLRPPLGYKISIS